MDLQDTDSELIGNQPETVSKDAFDEFLSNYSKENFTEEVNRISTNVTQEQFERMNENKRRAEEKRKSRSLHTTNAELNLEKID